MTYRLRRPRKFDDEISVYRTLFGWQAYLKGHEFSPLIGGHGSSFEKAKVDLKINLIVKFKELDGEKKLMMIQQRQKDILSNYVVKF